LDRTTTARRTTNERPLDDDDERRRRTRGTRLAPRTRVSHFTRARPRAGVDAIPAY
jgi:hypothetical protein